VIQKHWRRHNERRRFSNVKIAAMKIQHAYRGWKLRIDFLRKRRAAIVIQSHLRGVFAREVAAALREMRRVEEEMRKRERLEAERKQREAEQAEADRLALEESERLVDFGIFISYYTHTPTNDTRKDTPKLETCSLEKLFLHFIIHFLSVFRETACDLTRRPSYHISIFVVLHLTLDRYRSLSLSS
jgi:hypothetical protein